MDWDAIEAYAEAHSTPPAELFMRLDAETRQTQNTPAMMIGGSAQLFAVAMQQPQLVLEIGTFTGWSSLAWPGAAAGGAHRATSAGATRSRAHARRAASSTASSTCSPATKSIERSAAHSTRVHRRRQGRLRRLHEEKPFEVATTA